MLTAENWPIAANMLTFGSTAPGGGHIKDAPASVWAVQLGQVKALGIDQIDPTDAWVPLAELPEERLAQFSSVLNDLGMTIPSISMTRRSIVDLRSGETHLEQAHRLIDLAPRFGATIVNIGFMQGLTGEQEDAIWFWLADGHVDSAEYRDLAIERTRILADHAARNGVQLSLEMYEDTYVGTPDDALEFLRDIDHEAVGLNPDLGNLIRLHRPIEDYRTMFERLLPRTNFWHIKNYTRDFDPATGAYATSPVPLKYGYINYRQIIRQAIELGFTGPFCCEHYGSDSLGVIAENHDYIREVLHSALSPEAAVPALALAGGPR
ncbi:sugar phosphate isomerase/epimerase [Pseudactinotalea sp. HY158]|uniref:sugar phosphate isomerase/epimerase family protein n=1 Tax=Pseudactinotalea sp. HY158 TaxID=2654547 RepID=UPI00129C51B6|nr:sugar phosphate isomerase/epimerase family protein [Pseudactinotalea sp. HY158]QGH70060.1 TIM barrel protein [Pseudactinotalea sp. HY158]